MSDTSHHTEVGLFPPLAWEAEDYKDRHYMRRFRDPSYTGPWDRDDTYLFDPRCPYCVERWANGYNGIIPVIP